MFDTYTVYACIVLLNYFWLILTFFLVAIRMAFMTHLVWFAIQLLWEITGDGVWCSGCEVPFYFESWPDVMGDVATCACSPSATHVKSERSRSVVQICRKLVRIIIFIGYDHMCIHCANNRGFLWTDSVVCCVLQNRNEPNVSASWASLR